MNERVIVTKYKTVKIPEGTIGTPIEKAWSETAIPERLKGALVYDLPDGQYIAQQDLLED